MKTRYFISIVLITLLIFVGCSKEEEEEEIFPFDEVEGNYLIDLSPLPVCHADTFFIHRLDETKFSFSLDTDDCDTLPDFTFKLVSPFKYESHLYRYSAKFELINNPMFHMRRDVGGDFSRFYYREGYGSFFYMKLVTDDSTHVSIMAEKIE